MDILELMTFLASTGEEDQFKIGFNFGSATLHYCFIGNCCTTDHAFKIATDLALAKDGSVMRGVTVYGVEPRNAGQMCCVCGTTHNGEQPEWTS